MIKDEIENKLNEDLNPWFLDVINESPNHNAVSYTHLTLPTNLSV